MKKIFVCWLIFATIFAFGSGDVTYAAKLDDISQAVDSYIEVRKEGTASVSLGVFKEGELVHKTQYGYIDEENKRLADENAIYEWGSVSKTLVWISLMQLEESGQIDFNTDVKTYLPKEFASKLKYPYPISLQDIMNLQTGFQEVGMKVEYEEDEPIPELADLLIDSQPKQVFKPGTVTAYNNWTPALAAYVVESVTGQPFSEYVQEHIFRPLGMEHTAVAADWSDNLYVQKHRPESKAYYYTTETHDSLGTCILHIGLYPAGAAAGTFDDFLTFAMEFTKDHPRFFEKADTFDTMKEASVLYADGLPRIHHGLLSIDDAEHLIGHSGNTQGFTSSFWFEPKTRTGYAVMTNEPAETAYNYGLAQLLFGTERPKAEKGADISGLYTSQRTIHRGSLRLVKYLAGILPIRTTDKEGVFRIPLADMTVTYLGNHRYHFDSGNGLIYQVVETDEGNVLETFTADNQRLAMPELVTAYGLIIAMIVIAIAMIVRVIYRIVRRLRTKTPGEISPGFASHIAATAVSVAFFYLWLMAGSYSKLKLGVVAGVCVGCSVVILIHFIRRLADKNRRGEYALISVTWPLIIPVAVCFFQLYYF